MNKALARKIRAALSNNQDVFAYFYSHPKTDEEAKPLQVLSYFTTEEEGHFVILDGNKEMAIEFDIDFKIIPKYEVA